LNIESLLQRKPKDLSGGQRQRVAIGRAIVREPQVFLFDEPLSNLDAKLRGHMRAELALLHERLGKTTVYVTHDQVEAMTLATRIVIFDKGRIQQIGTPEEVFNWPANVFVAGFIGMPTMNFFKAQISFVQGQMRLHAQGLDWPAPDWLANARWPRGHPVTLGLRPQALKANAAITNAAGANAADADATHPRLTLAIEVVEYLGNESLVMGTHSALAAQRISAMVSGNAQSQHKQKIDFSFNSEDLHVFDSETGLSLRPRAA
jgi:ABC-type sugar transport system ATPase subunit